MLQNLYNQNDRFRICRFLYADSIRADDKRLDIPEFKGMTAVRLVQDSFPAAKHHP
jgi:hypothetical protein